jgi:hypothetical protein
MDNSIEWIERIFQKTEAQTKRDFHINRAGTGLRIHDCLDIARNLRDKYLTHDETKMLVSELCDRLSSLHDSFKA